MDYSKTLTGASIAVATVVALPIAGPVGTITAVGAAVALGVGSLCGFAVEYFSDSDSEVQERGRRMGEESAKAEYAQRITALEVKLKEALSLVNEHANYFNSIIAMTSVAMACANRYGFENKQETTQVRQLINGFSANLLPSHIQTKIDDIYRNPPTDNEAFKLALNSGVRLPVFNEIIEFVLQVNGAHDAKGVAFLDAWNITKTV